MPIRLLALLTALLLSPVAHAFGVLGHEVVAEIAARKLTPHARAEVERLLGDRASNAMRESANWADEMLREPGHDAFKPLHYVNFPRDSCRFEPARDCPGGQCLVGAIERYAAILGESHDDAERAQALRFVIHFVADAHQPLHAGFRDDLGGNKVQLQFRGRGTNLHQLWDSGLLNERGLRAVPYADLLLRSPPAQLDTRWSAQAPARWVEESCALIDGAQIYAAHARVKNEYVRRNLPVVERRVTEAGLRLAALLNALL